jgi:hypothetical protein
MRELDRGTQRVARVADFGRALNPSRNGSDIPCR